MTLAPFNPQSAILEMAPTVGYEEIARRCETCKSNVAAWVSGTHLPGRVRWQLLETMWQEWRVCQTVAKVQKSEQRCD